MPPPAQSTVQLSVGQSTWQTPSQWMAQLPPLQLAVQLCASQR
jgi:hypothetical protein